jgi:hypothetical protein
MANTLTFSESAKGWPSYYSFIPDWILGMNNYLYTFKGGNLYRHNTNETRNTFYYEWWTQESHPENAFEPSSLITVFNESPLENKIYKTISLVGDAPWNITDISTDLQSGFLIDTNWLEKKEASWFAFIRNTFALPTLSDGYPLRSLNGIGRSSVITGSMAALEVRFAISPTPISIGSIISVGDYVYYCLPPYTSPLLLGQIDNIIVDYVAGNNKLVVNTLLYKDSILITSIPGIQDPYILIMKNTMAESNGILGHYALIEMENNSTSKIELFVIESEIQRSYP